MSTQVLNCHWRLHEVDGRGSPDIFAKATWDRRQGPARHTVQEANDTIAAAACCLSGRHWREGLTVQEGVAQPHSDVEQSPGESNDANPQPASGIQGCDQTVSVGRGTYPEAKGMGGQNRLLREE